MMQLLFSKTLDPTTCTRLAQADEQLKDVRIVVEHGAGLDVLAELRLALRVQRLIEVLLAGVKAVLAQRNRPGRSTRS